MVCVPIDTLDVSTLEPHTFRYQQIHKSAAVLANKLLTKHLNVESVSICYLEPTRRTLQPKAKTVATATTASTTTETIKRKRQ